MKSSRYSPEQVTSITSVAWSVSSRFPRIFRQDPNSVYTNVIGVRHYTINLIVCTSLLTVLTHL